MNGIARGAPSRGTRLGTRRQRSTEGLERPGQGLEACSSHGVLEPGLLPNGNRESLKGQVEILPAFQYHCLGSDGRGENRK